MTKDLSASRPKEEAPRIGWQKPPSQAVMGHTLRPSTHGSLCAEGHSSAGRWRAQAGLRSTLPFATSGVVRFLHSPGLSTFGVEAGPRGAGATAMAAAATPHALHSVPLCGPGRRRQGSRCWVRARALISGPQEVNWCYCLTPSPLAGGRPRGGWQQEGGVER